MHKPSLLTFGAAAAVLVLAGCGQKTPAPAASAPASAVAAGEAVSVPFAVAGPTSGGIAHIGKDVENGVRMALDEINATKPVIGGKAVTFKIVAEDDAGDAIPSAFDVLRQPDPELTVVIYGQGGRHADLHGWFLLYVDNHAEKGQPRRQVTDADSRTPTTTRRGLCFHL